MSRRWVLAALAVSACGFRPAYVPGNTGGIADGAVIVAEDNSRYGILLTRRLQEAFGQPTAPRYVLSFEVETDSDEISEATSQAIDRRNLIGGAGYSLATLDGGETVLEGYYDTFVSYSADESGLATTTAQRDGYQRLMIALAEGIVADILARADLGQ